MNATEEIKRQLDQLVGEGENLQGLIKGDIATPEFIEAYQRRISKNLINGKVYIL